ncbi:MAG: T9SS type A sorting domain-containing protein [Bacteroidota bacterium]
MNRNSTLIPLFSLLALLYYKPSSATTYINYGTATNYNLAAGDSLYIASGTYTGNITGFATGAKITVASGAVFQPADIASPNMHGTLYVYGTFKYTSATQLKTNADFTLHNYGTVWITSSVQMNGTNQVWNNYFGALMKLDGDVSMTSNNSIINQGTTNFGAKLTQTNTTNITNKYTITVAGNYLNSGGTLTNEGRFQTTGSITFNAGTAIIYNKCRLIADGGITNTTGFVHNDGFMWARTNAGTGSIVNSGTLTNGPIARMQSSSLNNTGTINGAGYIYVTGTTTTTGVGTTGVSGVTTDTIRIYDVSRNNPATIYDNQSGIVRPNVKYSVFQAPDSTMAYIPGCSAEMMSQIPLAINWEYFFVALSENTPALNWSAQYDKGTVFEIQRSYDGVNFYKIKDQGSVNTRSVYTYNDEHVNSKSPIVYYRIKAVEPSGNKKYSDTRTVKFSNKSDVSLQTTPNPFTSDFIINYQTTEAGRVSINVYNLNGQLKMSKIVAVNNGFNNITMLEASRLAKGMYVVQVMKDNQLISTEKIIKQ